MALILHTASCNCSFISGISLAYPHTYNRELGLQLAAPHTGLIPVKSPGIGLFYLTLLPSWAPWAWVFFSLTKLFWLMVIYGVEYFVESQIATCSLQLTCFFWSQVTHVWALHPTVHFLSLLFTFNFHILVYNIAILLGYWYYYIACFKYEEKNYEIPVNKPQVTRDYQISKEDRHFRTVSQNWKGN